MTTTTLGKLCTGLFTLSLMACSATAQGPTSQLHGHDKARPLDIKASTTKKAYDVNEPIVFLVTPNQTAYVYLFNVPEGNATATQLFPNQYEGGQPLVASQEATIPGKSTFRSAKPGLEKVVLVASTQPLTLSSTKSLGAFETLAAQEVDTLVKQIRIDPPTVPQQLVQQLDVRIKGQETRTAPVATTSSSRRPRPAALIATDKIIYGATEGVTITYGADTSGHLAMYLLTPAKQVALLKDTTVERDTTYKLRAEAIPPAGEHVLLAVFNTKPKPAGSTEAFVTRMLTPERTGKDLRLIEEPDAHAMYRFVTQY